MEHEDHAETRSSHPPKRRKTACHDQGNAVPHSHYTIAWICALYIEMAAARSMLDELHDDLPRHTNDNNCYTLGSIKQHSVVIACLPDAQYGTNNAATVLTNLTRTFPSIRMGLVVGIGGGVPSRADIRLGDIVVGTRVMQYDLGKVVEDGKIQRTAIPKIPGYSLRTVVSNLRAKHELEPSRVPSILRERIERYPGYGRPSSPDRLFQTTYHHESPTSDCDECDQTKLVLRGTRMSDDPIIHYGAIASGNQVMKHGITRDTVARELDIICFEMEAAGLMDVLPCLPIRGICDYSDSHKTKGWQQYAAATAAAYAREFLEVLPMAEAHQVAETRHEPTSKKGGGEEERRKRLLHFLRFVQIDSRKTTIEDAHTKTCHWFLKHPEYQAWLNPKRLAYHHGLLWIRGKPGVGKSTIMKFVYLKTKMNDRSKCAITASFFFNARGADLEKSTRGMYRSLLLQLLDGFDDLQKVFDNTDLVPWDQDDCPSLNVLKGLFRNAVSDLGERSFTCFVDALDECDEQQVMDMVQYFEDLAEHCTHKGVRLRICFSSRHYPYIDVRLGIRLTLEDQDGHNEDLANYLQSHLRIKDPATVKEVRTQLLEKAAGVFLWVVLVVNILNKENRRGRLAFRKRLAEIPSGLTALFRDLLKRDNENMEELLLSILWILYARRPLRPEEYYHALWSSLALKHLVDPEIPDVTVSDASDCVDSYVTTSSKGLAEITKAKPPTVQFIHESVRDFLVKDGGLHELWPDIGFDWRSLSHERLKQGCHSYMNHQLVRASVRKLQVEANSKGQTEISKEYPLLEYASQHVLYHANAAADTIPQAKFLSRFSVPAWVSIISFFDKFGIREYSPNASLFYLLAEEGFSALIRARLEVDPCIHVFGERYRYPLFAALANGNKDAVAALLNSPSSIYNGVDITEGLNCENDLKEYKARTPLSWAAQNGREGIAKLLLQTGTTVNGVDGGGQTPLLRASWNGHEAVARLLIDNGANINAHNEDGWTPLLRASWKGHEAVVGLLIDKGAHINARNEDGSTSFFRALENGHEAVARLLIDRGADVNARNKYGSTPLLRASGNGYGAVARLLIDKGADVNARDKNGSTPLLRASWNGHEAVVMLLIDKGANVNTSNQNRSTPLLRALENGHETVARLLIDKGADVNTGDKYGSTPLLRALENGHEAVARLLIDKGADVNTCNKYGSTPLLRALENGFGLVARLLIDKGADFNVYDKYGLTPLLRALENGHEAVARLLIDKGADINTCNKYGSTPLLRALENGYGLVARLLIDKGAHTNARNEDGSTPLLQALENGHETVVGLLIDKGTDVNTCNKYGWTPLLRALENGHEAVASLLIDKGADVNVYDKYGLTPLLRALENGHEAVASLLIDKGADFNIYDKYGLTPLLRALENGHEAVARLLIDKGADVNTCNKYGSTPLLRALENGYGLVARLLIDNGADVKTSNKYGSTPLLQALENDDEAVARLLIDKGADVNASDKYGSTPLLRAIENGHEVVAMLLIDRGADIKASSKGGSTPLLQASRNGHEAVVRLLIDKGADVKASDKYGWTPLLQASRNGHEAVARLLIDNGADINAHNEDGWTPLLQASRNGHEAVARLLIDNGADINAHNEDGWTPLLQASRNGHEAVARLLIDKGAHTNARNEDGSTPLLQALENNHETVLGLLIDKGADVNASDKYGSIPLLRASRNGHEAVVRLLIDKGADVNTSNKFGWTPLLQASRNGHEAVVRLLIDKGADVKASDKYGSTPPLLSGALQNGHEAVARLLIDKGADINARDENGSTPLLRASGNGHEAMARLLIDKGADVNVYDKYGWTPFLQASRNGHEAVARLLTDNGAAA